MGKGFYTLRVEYHEKALSLELSISDRRVGAYDSTPFDLDVAKKFAENILETVERFSTRSSSDTLVAEDLEGSVDTLYNLIFHKIEGPRSPHKLAERLRSAQPGSCLVLRMHRDLTCLPWELLYDGQRFFCERFRLIRQVIGEEEQLQAWEDQMQKEYVQSAFIGLGNVNTLDHKGEKKSVDQALSQLYVSPPTKRNMAKSVILRELRKGHTVFHYIGHAQHVEGCPPKTGWKCGDGILTCADIEAYVTQGTWPFLIFANACETARPSLGSESQVADLHLAFCLKGVPHYVGTIAQIPDKLSAEFVEVFYGDLAKGTSIDKALWQARQFFLKKPGPPIWAYYVHYGMPHSRLPGTEAAIPRPLGVVAESTYRLLNKYESKVVVGRDRELARLDGFLGGSDSGTLVITAEPGVGKTAFLAKWIAARRGENSLIAYHFFSSQDDYLHSVSNAYRHLLQQLRIIYELEEAPEDDKESLQDAFCKLLYKHRIYSTKPLVVITDAIDEADGRFSPPPTPPGVFVIVSARADEEEKPPYLDGWIGIGERLHLPHLSPEMITLWLSSVDKGKLAALAHDEEIVGELERKTGGLPLYLDFLVQDMIRAVDEGRNPRQVAESSPMGFSAYVYKQWELLAQKHVPREVLHLFALLSVVLGPLSAKDVSTLTGLTPGEIRSLPWHIARWLTIKTSRTRPLQCTIAHPLLAEEFARIPDVQPREALEKLLEYCGDWKKDQDRHHALRYYAEYLHRAGRVEDLFELARNESFRQGQTAQLPAEPDLPLRTVQTALSAAAEGNQASRIAEFLILHATLVGALRRDSPLEALRGNDLERALALADLYPPEEASLWHLVLAWELQDHERADDGRAVLRRVLQRKLSCLSREAAGIVLIAQVFELSDDAFRILYERLLDDGGRFHLCRYLTKRGYLAAARQVAQEIMNENLQQAALEEIAGMCPAGSAYERDRDRALRSLAAPGFDEFAEEEIEYGYRSLSEIAKEQANAGNQLEAKTTLTLALEVARQIKWSFMRRRSLVGIARAQAEVGDGRAARTTFGLALMTATPMQVEQHHAQLKAVFAEVLAERHEFDVALETARQIRVDNHRVCALVAVAEAQGTAGDTEAARRTIASAFQDVQQIEYGPDKVSALATIADGYTRIGDIEVARKTLHDALQVEMDVGLDWRDERDAALGAVALAQARAGELAAFETAAQMDYVGEMLLRITHAFMGTQVDSENVCLALQATELADRSDETFKLVSIASAQAKAGDVQAARMSLARAYQDARQFGDEWWVVQALSAIANEQVAIGEQEAGRVAFADALRLAQGLEGKGLGATLLARVAQAQAKAGYWRDALRTAEMIVTDREYSLPDVVEALVKSGDKKNWKSLLLPCAYELHAAYRMCGLLARVYPEQVSAVARVVAERIQSDQPTQTSGVTSKETA